jgi:hypothetical protein
MEKRPIYPIHPREILADELAELNKTPTELARELHVPANRISQLVAGKKDAFLFQKVFKRGPSIGIFWHCFHNFATSSSSSNSHAGLRP